jgi:hypothetical protein
MQKEVAQFVPNGESVSLRRCRTRYENCKIAHSAYHNGFRRCVVKRRRAVVNDLTTQARHDRFKRIAGLKIELPRDALSERVDRSL